MGWCPHLRREPTGKTVAIDGAGPVAACATARPYGVKAVDSTAIRMGGADLCIWRSSGKRRWPPPETSPAWALSSNAIPKWLRRERPTCQEVRCGVPGAHDQLMRDLTTKTLRR